ncbi:hypothetical protein VFPPC_08940 [Pochonia chlamydosporia 170]|uniref:Uncharacterized protein n=1 Tax=Pochonia chlamydosporia 170 TaxID=1380566 RepID=A0A179FC29_METCM|nr:hypothetical protein VFPPC_08940 [Pochonia chlamydosporia 170]OAQ63026.2 hypothetical protein VFPPC_08940 [Pochonia chlamydosporia 170]
MTELVSELQYPILISGVAMCSGGQKYFNKSEVLYRALCFLRRHIETCWWCILRCGQIPFTTDCICSEGPKVIEFVKGVKNRIQKGSYATNIPYCTAMQSVEGKVIPDRDSTWLAAVEVLIPVSAPMS